MLQRGWDKYGAEAFSWRILEAVPHRADLLAREQHWMDTLGAADRATGFNLAPKAGSALGVKRSERWLALMRAAMTGHKPTADAIEAARLVNLGGTHSTETKARRRASLDAARADPLYGPRLAAAQAGRTHTEEAKARMRKPKSPETRANMRKPKTAEHRANIGAGGRAVAAAKRRMAAGEAT